MSGSNKLIANVPTNIVTGFLGAGKTTAINYLLEQKPASERWAVLVNEFGEIGVDGSLLDGRISEASGIFIRELPGGCMCCTAGLPMQIALNQLLVRARPDRLLIEPTGLGHPIEVLQTLQSENYKGLLKVEKIATLLDARQLADARCAEDETFRQQLEIADLIIANKEDLYTQSDRLRFDNYLNQVRSSERQIIFTTYGQIDPGLLSGPTRYLESSENQLSIHDQNTLLEDSGSVLHEEESLPPSGFLEARNSGGGFRSIGWRFDSRFEFDQKALLTQLAGMKATRIKAVFITDKGVFGYNLTSDALTEFPLDHAIESRVEIISREIDEQWRSQIIACIKSNQPERTIDLSLL